MNPNFKKRGLVNYINPSKTPPGFHSFSLSSSPAQVPPHFLPLKGYRVNRVKGDLGAGGKGRVCTIFFASLSETFFNFTFDKGRLKSLVSWTLDNYGEYKTVELLEQLKKTGFEYATKAGISLGIEDLKIPPKKASLLLEAEQLTRLTVHQYQRGDITAVERFKRLIDTWHRTSEQLKQEVISYFEETDILNPVYMMAFSGARGNISQVRQLVGMRGLMSDPKGQIIDFPIRSNFREGLTLTEYIISSYGSRKGIVDTALRTANAGYLTRRLVDVAQHVIISHYDCGTQKGIFLTDMKEGNKNILSLQNRLIGRVLARDIYKKDIFLSDSMELQNSVKIANPIPDKNEGDKVKGLPFLPSLPQLYPLGGFSAVPLTPKGGMPVGQRGKKQSEGPVTNDGLLQTPYLQTDGLLVKGLQQVAGGKGVRTMFGLGVSKEGVKNELGKRNQEISSNLAVEIARATNRVFVRSSLTCNTNKLICQLCYGWSLAQGKLVSVGETVGVIAAQSIGEPGTQLTMRTFHTGGVFSGDVSDEIRAPFDGFVEYTHSIPGTLIRTLDGKIAFLTKSDGTLILKKKQNNIISEAYKFNSEEGIKSGDPDVKKYKIPAYTILFIRNGADVFKKQVVAQITNVSTQPNMLDTAEYTIKSELEGLFYAKNLDLQKQIIGPKPKLAGELKNVILIDQKAMKIDLKSRDWNFAWVLSGKRYELPFFAPLFPTIGDYITTKTIMTQNNWMPSNVNSKIKSIFVPHKYFNKINPANPFPFAKSLWDKRRGIETLSPFGGLAKGVCLGHSPLPLCFATSNPKGVMHSPKLVTNRRFVTSKGITTNPVPFLPKQSEGQRGKGVSILGALPQVRGEKLSLWDSKGGSRAGHGGKGLAPLLVALPQVKRGGGLYKGVSKTAKQGRAMLLMVGNLKGKGKPYKKKGENQIKKGLLGLNIQKITYNKLGYFFIGSCVNKKQSSLNIKNICSNAVFSLRHKKIKNIFLTPVSLTNPPVGGIKNMSSLLKPRKNLEYLLEWRSTPTVEEMTYTSIFAQNLSLVKDRMLMPNRIEVFQQKFKSYFVEAGSPSPKRGLEPPLHSVPLHSVSPYPPRGISKAPYLFLLSTQLNPRFTSNPPEGLAQGNKGFSEGQRGGKGITSKAGKPSNVLVIPPGGLAKPFLLALLTPLPYGHTPYGGKGYVKRAVPLTPKGLGGQLHFLPLKGYRVKRLKRDCKNEGVSNKGKQLGIRQGISFVTAGSNPVTFFSKKSQKCLVFSNNKKNKLKLNIKFSKALFSKTLNQFLNRQDPKVFSFKPRDAAPKKYYNVMNIKTKKALNVYFEFFNLPRKVEPTNQRFVGRPQFLRPKLPLPTHCQRSSSLWDKHRVGIGAKPLRTLFLPLTPLYPLRPLGKKGYGGFRGSRGKNSVFTPPLLTCYPPMGISQAPSKVSNKKGKNVGDSTKGKVMSKHFVVARSKQILKHFKCTLIFPFPLSNRLGKENVALNNLVDGLYPLNPLYNPFLLALPRSRAGNGGKGLERSFIPFTQKALASPKLVIPPGGLQVKGKERSSVKKRLGLLLMLGKGNIPKVQSKNAIILSDLAQNKSASFLGIKEKLAKNQGGIVSPLLHLPYTPTSLISSKLWCIKQSVGKKLKLLSPRGGLYKLELGALPLVKGKKGLLLGAMPQATGGTKKVKARAKQIKSYSKTLLLNNKHYLSMLNYFNKKPLSSYTPALLQRAGSNPVPFLPKPSEGPVTNDGLLQTPYSHPLPPFTSNPRGITSTYTPLGVRGLGITTATSCWGFRGCNKLLGITSLNFLTKLKVKVWLLNFNFLVIQKISKLILTAKKMPPTSHLLLPGPNRTTLPFVRDEVPNNNMLGYSSRVAGGFGSVNQELVKKVGSVHGITSGVIYKTTAMLNKKGYTFPGEFLCDDILFDKNIVYAKYVQIYEILKITNMIYNLTPLKKWIKSAKPRFIKNNTFINTKCCSHQGGHSKPPSPKSLFTHRANPLSVILPTGGLVTGITSLGDLVKGLPFLPSLPQLYPLGGFSAVPRRGKKPSEGPVTNDGLLQTPYSHPLPPFTSNPRGITSTGGSSIPFARWVKRERTLFGLGAAKSCWGFRGCNKLLGVNKEGVRDFGYKKQEPTLSYNRPVSKAKKKHNTFNNTFNKYLLFQKVDETNYDNSSDYKKLLIEKTNKHKNHKPYFIGLNRDSNMCVQNSSHNTFCVSTKKGITDRPLCPYPKGVKGITSYPSLGAKPLVCPLLTDRRSVSTGKGVSKNRSVSKGIRSRVRVVFSLPSQKKKSGLVASLLAINFLNKQNKTLNLLPKTTSSDLVIHNFEKKGILVTKLTEKNDCNILKIATKQNLSVKKLREIKSSPLKILINSHKSKKSSVFIKKNQTKILSSIQPLFLDFKFKTPWYAFTESKLAPVPTLKLKEPSLNIFLSYSLLVPQLSRQATTNFSREANPLYLPPPFAYPKGVNSLSLWDKHRVKRGKSSYLTGPKLVIPFTSNPPGGITSLGDLSKGKGLQQVAAGLEKPLVNGKKGITKAQTPLKPCFFANFNFLYKKPVKGVATTNYMSNFEGEFLYTKPYKKYIDENPYKDLKTGLEALNKTFKKRQTLDEKVREAMFQYYLQKNKESVSTSINTQTHPLKRGILASKSKWSRFNLIITKKDLISLNYKTFSDYNPFLPSLPQLYPLYPLRGFRGFSAVPRRGKKQSEGPGVKLQTPLLTDRPRTSYPEGVSKNRSVIPLPPLTSNPRGITSTYTPLGVRGLGECITPLLTDRLSVSTGLEVAKQRGQHTPYALKGKKGKGLQQVAGGLAQGDRNFINKALLKTLSDVNPKAIYGNSFLFTNTKAISIKLAIVNKEVHFNKINNLKSMFRQGLGKLGGKLVKPPVNIKLKNVNSGQIAFFSGSWSTLEIIKWMVLKQKNYLVKNNVGTFFFKGNPFLLKNPTLFNYLLSAQLNPLFTYSSLTDPGLLVCPTNPFGVSKGVSGAKGDKENKKFGQGTEKGIKIKSEYVKALCFNTLAGAAENPLYNPPLYLGVYPLPFLPKQSEGPVPNDGLLQTPTGFRGKSYYPLCFATSNPFTSYPSGITSLGVTHSPKLVIPNPPRGGKGLLVKGVRGLRERGGRNFIPSLLALRVKIRERSVKSESKATASKYAPFPHLTDRFLLTPEGLVGRSVSKGIQQINVRYLEIKPHWHKIKYMAHTMNANLTDTLIKEASLLLSDQRPDRERNTHPLETKSRDLLPSDIRGFAYRPTVCYPRKGITITGEGVKFFTPQFQPTMRKIHADQNVIQYNFQQYCQRLQSIALLGAKPLVCLGLRPLPLWGKKGKGGNLTFGKEGITTIKDDLIFYTKPVIKKSGQLIHMNKQIITLRLGQPIVISPRSIIHTYHGDFVSFKTPVITLTYQQLKTGDIVQGIPKIEQLFEARTTKRGRLFRDNLTNLLTGLFLKYYVKSSYLLKKDRFRQNSTVILAMALKWSVKQSFYKIQQIIVDGILRVYRSQGVSISDKHVEIIVKQMTSKVRIINSNSTKFNEYIFSLNTVNRQAITYLDNQKIIKEKGVNSKSPESTSDSAELKKEKVAKTKIKGVQLLTPLGYSKEKPKATAVANNFDNLLVETLIENNLEGPAGLFPGEIVDLDFVENINRFLLKTGEQGLPTGGWLDSTSFTVEPIKYEPIVLGITRASLEVESFLSAASFQQTTRVLSQAALYKKKDFLKGLKENILIGNLIPAGTGYLSSIEI